MGLGLEVIIFFLPHTHILVSSVDVVKNKNRIFCFFVTTDRKRPFFVFPIYKLSLSRCAGGFQ